jgi:hypothetical protein
MTVVRVFEVGGGKSNGRCFRMTPQHPAFTAIRATSGATQQRAEYKSLREQGGAFAALPNITKADQIWPALAAFEAKNPGNCELLRDDGQFFGFTNVAKGALQKATSFVFIPAARDASADALDTRGAVIAKLLELVVKSAIQRRKEIQEFQSKITAEYKELTDPEKLYELGHLSEDLTDTLQVFYREAAVSLSWRPRKTSLFLYQQPRCVSVTLRLEIRHGFRRVRGDVIILNGKGEHLPQRLDHAVRPLGTICTRIATRSDMLRQKQLVWFSRHPPRRCDQGSRAERIGFAHSAAYIRQRYNTESIATRTSPC